MTLESCPCVLFRLCFFVLYSLVFVSCLMSYVRDVMKRRKNWGFMGGFGWEQSERCGVTFKSGAKDLNFWDKKQGARAPKEVQRWRQDAFVEGKGRREWEQTRGQRGSFWTYWECSVGMRLDVLRLSDLVIIKENEKYSSLQRERRAMFVLYFTGVIQLGTGVCENKRKRRRQDWIGGKIWSKPAVD